jgi:anti-anti-sigma factor
MARHSLRPPREEAADDVTVVHFTGSKICLDGETLHATRDQLLGIAEERTASPLVLDFGNVDSISTLALGTLVYLHKQLLAARRHLSIRNLSPQVYEAFALTKLDRLLDLQRAEPRTQPSTDDRADCAGGVLVVDDEAAVLSALEVGLQCQGYLVWTAAHGQQAVTLYRRHRKALDVVLLDVLMPGMDGPAVLRALQKVAPTVRCFFMTGNPSPYTEEGLVQMGAVGVFRKPFAFTEVLDTLCPLMSRSARRRQDRWIEISRPRSHNDVDLESQAG